MPSAILRTSARRCSGLSCRPGSARICTIRSTVSFSVSVGAPAKTGHARTRARVAATDATRGRAYVCMRDTAATRVPPSVSMGRRSAELARELHDVQARVGAVGEIDQPAVVELAIVGLDRHLAARRPADVHAALVGVGGRRRDEIAGLARTEGIPDVDRANAGVEVGEEHELAVVDGRERLVGRVRTEAAAARAKVAGLLRHLEGGDGERRALAGDVDEERELPRLLAFVLQR